MRMFMVVGPGLTSPDAISRDYLEEVAIQTAKCVFSHHLCL